MKKELNWDVIKCITQVDKSKVDVERCPLTAEEIGIEPFKELLVNPAEDDEGLLMYNKAIRTVNKTLFGDDND